ncbi:MAG: prolyl oligopeptidase family serine peptidase [Burkholderia sp.]|uniref:alpha/beta hydrolase family protein n=2 Tax=Burkholderia sp. TaxID=36773 RepID=UPI00258AE508|nr:alpha/beta hydrolase [Burkholderia sp.]MCA3890766.1 prolyl oligopeptidase family serine peptidase [Burkholderia sp.]
MDTKNGAPGRYEKNGWVQWPGQPELSFQFARTLGAAQEGASLISECFLAASRMAPGDTESWYREWQALARTSETRANEAFEMKRFRTASSNWLRAANYYRSSEFYLGHDDPRRTDTFESVERCSKRYLAGLTPAGEVVRVPYENGAHLDAYFIPCAGSDVRSPVVIAFGGLDEYKDERLHEMPKHALPRGMSLLLVDLPGQGGTLRRQKIVNRPDTQVPVGACVDYLLTRADVDSTRIGLYGASVGGVYAALAAAAEKRVAAVVSDSVMFDMSSLFAEWLDFPDKLIWGHLKWVFGCTTPEAVVQRARVFTLNGVINNISVPYLVLQGTEDWLGLETATDTYDYAKKSGVNAELKLFHPEETGAAHCQIDNPTLGQEFVCDWLAEKLGVDQASARARYPALA